MALKGHQKKKRVWLWLCQMHFWLLWLVMFSFWLCLYGFNVLANESITVLVLVHMYLICLVEFVRL